MNLEIVLVTVLLISPSEISPTVSPLLEVLRPAILAVSVDAEIIDHRGRAFLLIGDLCGDLAMLRRRVDELAGVPLLVECARFPDRKLLTASVESNRAYRTSLMSRLSIDSIYAEEIRGAISETDQLYQILDTTRDACCDYYYVTVRREALRLLRELIGAEAFYSGQLPPPVPVRHLHRE